MWCALGLSSALFGALHLGNPDADPMAVLGIILGGIPLAALYVLTGRLWTSIGYHIAWNFTERNVFGAQVSGTGLGPSLYQARPVAEVDPLWSGGAFGPEASIATMVLGFLVGAALLARRNGAVADVGLQRPDEPVKIVGACGRKYDITISRISGGISRAGSLGPFPSGLPGHRIMLVGLEEDRCLEESNATPATLRSSGGLAAPLLMRTSKGRPAAPWRARHDECREAEALVLARQGAKAATRMEEAHELLKQQQERLQEKLRIITASAPPSPRRKHVRTVGTRKRQFHPGRLDRGSHAKRKAAR